MLRSDFGFDLPPHLIAQEPRPRGRSRMLVVTPTAAAPALSHRLVGDLSSFIGKGDVVVFNDTKVFPARLFAAPRGNMKRGIEVLLTREVAPLLWTCWCRPARRLRRGDELVFSEDLRARVLEKTNDGVTLEFLPSGPAEDARHLFWREVERLGTTPLPPYIHRTEPLDGDREAYQTVYAGERGAIAAPTAGLHFTRELIDEIAGRGATVVYVTLHVGIGTFQPISADEISDHEMKSESYRLGEQAALQLNAAVREGRRIVAIGTTTVRLLESAFRAGSGIFNAGDGETSIFIFPGFEFRAVDALLTNFHLPESTLILLVSAFAGVETIRVAYEEAIREEYLFYSFGDCMFLTRRAG